ncbi:MAG: carbohydrate ABC transporter permease [Alicyclobacillus sp.]|nr:carbohydrate ABC transporter permease [Alicyclobacillus sp.]
MTTHAQRVRGGYAGRSLVYLVLIAFALISILPIFWMLLAAIKPSSELAGNPFAWPRSLTLQNLVQAWTVGEMGRYFVNSLIVAVPRVLGILVLATLAGYGFAKLRFPGRNKLFLFMLYGLAVPIQAMIIPLYVEMQHLGLIDTYWAMIVPYYGLSMPFAIFMMRAFFREIPDELMEAARIDGCGDLRAFLHVMVPLILPALSSLLVFEFMWSWNDFLIPLLFVYSDQLRTLPLGLMYFSTQYTTNQSLVAAGVAITTVPILVVYFLFQRKFIQGLTAGAVK